MCKGGHSSFLHGVPPGVKLSNNIKKSELGRYTAKPSYDIVGGGAGQPGEAQQGRHARRGHTQRWWSTLHLAPGRWLYLQPHSQQVCPEAGAGGQALQRQHQVALHALAYYAFIMDTDFGPKMLVLLGMDDLTEVPGHYNVEAAYKFFPHLRPGSLDKPGREIEILIGQDNADLLPKGGESWSTVAVPEAAINNDP